MSLLLLVASAGAATLTVGPRSTYTTINAALAASSSGDTIRVEAGTYAEDVDLRGKNVTLISQSGPARTVIAPTNSIRLDGGTLEGFTVSPAPATAIAVTSGSPTLRELAIVAPATYGVQVSGGSPLVEEVGVWNAGLHGFIVSAGTATIQRSVSYDAVNYGFAIKSGSTVNNSVAIGGAWGFVFENSTSTATNLVAVGASSGAVGALYTATVTNSVFQDNTWAVKCFNGALPVFPNGIAFETNDAMSCSTNPVTAMRESDPLFTRWDAALPLEQLDFRPTATSPMRNAGTGTDTDGSAADYGAFGGSAGGWKDRDGDGVPVLFDCDDHDAATYYGAAERADGWDNDCDDIVDEDIPVDTGGGDDTGTVDAGDTDVVDTDSGDTDTGPVAPTDLDGDGYATPTDCDDHNVATYPGAAERTDDADNDCDGAADEGTPYVDDDLDGYSELTGDCDDTRADRYPGARDSDEDGIDNDCDGKPDNAVGQDGDGDGYVDSVDDCDDTDAQIHPGAPDVTDSVDNDCDGTADEDGLDADRDGDGQSPRNGDCDDGDPAVYFGALDVADDFIDQDCSGTDNYDADRDGNASFASGGTDCDDDRSTVYPGAPELCGDGVDDDCDGEVEEGCDEGGPSTTEEGCGCATASPASGAALVGLALAVSARRRRRDGIARHA